jgi:copper chaperone
VCLLAAGFEASTGRCREIGWNRRLLIPSRGMERKSVTYRVPGISCSHCVSAIRSEVEQVAGVSSVEVDLDAKTVTVAGTSLDEAALVAAIDEAGYEIA